MLKRTAVMLVALCALCGSARAGITIVFATDATWPPMEFVNADGQIAGYSVDFMRAAGREAGFTPVFRNVAWEEIFAGLAAGRYDAVCSSVSITGERKKEMDFSEPYFTVHQALVVPKKSHVHDLADLGGRKVGAQAGTTGFSVIRAADGVIARPYEKIGLAMEDLNMGRIDAVVCDDPVAANYALFKYRDTLKVATLLRTGKAERYGVVVRKGNSRVLDLLNRGIAAVRARGIDRELEKKWIGR